MSEKKYTKDHEWISLQDQVATIGITNFAQESLGDIVFVELPKIGKLVKAGELLGQRSMISEESANLSAVALEDMEVCFVPKSEILQFFNQNNDFSMNVMKTICGDLKEADDHMVDMAQKTVKQRLAETLLYLEATFGKNEDGSIRIQLSREELAGMIGTATESCIRLLSEFNKAKSIELQGKKIFIKDKKVLQKIS